jgi:hypothetical protein
MSNVMYREIDLVLNCNALLRHVKWKACTCNVVACVATYLSLAELVKVKK